jgi:hypothetical protein
MRNNPLIQLEKHGQSIWLDYIRRDLMIAAGGEWRFAPAALDQGRPFAGE